MIAEMKTRVPGPISKTIDPQRIAWSGKFQGTNAWDVDDNCFLDLTSAGGALPFGYIDKPTITLEQCLPEKGKQRGYRAYCCPADFFAEKKVLHVGQSVESVFENKEEEQSISLETLAFKEGCAAEIICIKTECLDALSVQRIQSWCQQFNVKLAIDERDIGFFRMGEAFGYLNVEPDYLLTSVALGKFEKQDILYTPQSLQLKTAEKLAIESNYGDSGLARTINLQSIEMSELLKDMVKDKQIISQGSFHKIELEDKKEAQRVCIDLLQRGIIVSKLGTAVVLVPSLYLALGEIIFAANHIKAVVANIHEVSTPWMSDDLRH